MLLLRGATPTPAPSSALNWFQYMLLLRGATRPATAQADSPDSFNTCSSCEEQQNGSSAHDFVFMVSIHAPLARSNRRLPLRDMLSRFQYMLLLRGATEEIAALTKELNVSIHAPLARSNNTLFFDNDLTIRFNTCSSCEEQQRFRHCPRLGICFNTCSSCEEQQPPLRLRIRCKQFQYMLLLRGATCFSPSACSQYPSFNTCSSCEEQLFSVGSWGVL